MALLRRLFSNVVQVVGEGQSFPPWMGIAYRRLWQRTSVVAVVPLNVLVGGLHNMWMALRRSRLSKSEIEIVDAIASATARGYNWGYEDGIAQMETRAQIAEARAEDVEVEVRYWRAQVRYWRGRAHNEPVVMGGVVEMISDESIERLAEVLWAFHEQTNTVTLEEARAALQRAIEESLVALSEDEMIEAMWND